MAETTENKTAAQKLAETEIPVPKKPKPSDEDIRLARETLRRAEEAEVVGGEFGEGKPGKIKYTVPKTPPHLGLVTVNYQAGVHTTPDGKKVPIAKERRYVPGSQHMLTYDEIRDLEFRLDRLVRNEMVGRYGVGVEQKITINVTQERGEGGFAGFGRHKGPENF